MTGLVSIVIKELEDFIKKYTIAVYLKRRRGNYKRKKNLNLRHARLATNQLIHITRISMYVKLIVVLTPNSTHNVEGITA
jgi:hypothetical protein